MFQSRQVDCVTLLAVVLIVVAGCASKTYRFGSSTRPFSSTPSSANEVTVGGEHPRLDRLERTVYYPAKKMQEWFGRNKTDKPSDEALRELALLNSQEYLQLNQLRDVKIDVREYSPSEQWRRLRANDSISPFWKYTTGTLQHVEYCLLPSRVFRNDNYNVFTNTLSLNSTNPERALYNAGVAKYMRSQRYPGMYASACYLPVVPLYRDVQVANDVLSYARFREDWETEKKLYPQIYSSFGGDLVSQATSLVPAFAYVPFYVKPALNLGGRVSGNVTGKFIQKQREGEVAEKAHPGFESEASPNASPQ